MALTNLAGTSWMFSPTIDFQSYPLSGYQRLSFSSGGKTFTELYVSKSGTIYYYGSSGSANPCSNKQRDATWDTYCIINITGGKIATNAAFIAWLEENATPYEETYSVNKSSLIELADAIRTKSGTSEPLSFPDGFIAAINGI